jgi:hypothetical protein
VSQPTGTVQLVELAGVVPSTFHPAEERADSGAGWLDPPPASTRSRRPSAVASTVKGRRTSTSEASWPLRVDDAASHSTQDRR